MTSIFGHPGQSIHSSLGSSIVKQIFPSSNCKEPSQFVRGVGRNIARLGRAQSNTIRHTFPFVESVKA